MHDRPVGETMTASEDEPQIGEHESADRSHDPSWNVGLGKTDPPTQLAHVDLPQIEYWQGVS